MMKKGKETSLSDDIDLQQQQNQPCSSSSSSQFYPKIVPNLDDFDASKEDCVEYEDEYEDDDDDVVKKLENLRLGCQEADLSDNVFRDNDQLQQDEVLALESIYGENIFIRDNRNGQRSFQIYIHIELPEELTISTKLHTNTNNSEDFSYSFQVKYIPPIILTCLLPKSYPTHLPPYFTISVQWLDSVKISSLCSMLDSIWNEQHGLEVIYSWAEWLRTSAISYLGFDKEIILGPYGEKDHGDPRAISECVSADVDIPALKSYNEAQQLEYFRTNMQECCICFSEFAGSEFIRLPCLHFFCENCMKTYTEVCIQEGNVNRHSCPIAKCGGMIPSGLIKRWLGDEQFEKWENLSLQKTLESMTDVAYCPRCELPCIEDEDRHAQCAKCFFSFCTLCKEKRHVGFKCATPEMKLRMLQETQALMPMGQKQRMIQELLSVKEILRDAKQCPSCKMAISRTEGCNKMVCKNCGTFFCYLCNKSIDGYEHFSDGSCELHQKPTKSREIEPVTSEEQMKSRKLERQILASLYPDHGHTHTCRKCGKKNAKMGKNKLCWACEGRYCYLCREVVKRGSQRFGQKRCQHSLG